MLTTTSEGTGALFNSPPDRQTDTGPVMTGSFDVQGTKINVAAFLRPTKTAGINYLSLKLGPRDGPHFYGKLFTEHNKKTHTSPDYSGYLEVSNPPNGDRFQLSGWKKTSRRTSDAYISLTLSPMLGLNAPAEGKEVEDGKLPI